MPRSFNLPSRQIHLDFHTGPWIDDVGVDFDAAAFAKTMKKAHVNSVTVFAKCHHGHLYYNTKHPARHPGLKPGLGLLEKQVEALHREGIRAPIYLSVQCDEFAADTHPEWIARQEDGRPVGAGPLKPGWQILDMSTPYQEYLARQTREVLDLFKPVDGIFFDMCWDQPSLNNYFVGGMERENLNPANEADRKRYAREVALGYMKRFYDLIKRSSPRASVYFNGRKYYNLAREIAYQTQVEIEALPTGGWGYMYFPTNVRFARTFDRPYLGMTARFHKGWADFGGIKPYAGLEYETSQMMAHGAQCSIGDQLHPRGTLDRAAYDLIGAVYRRVEQREPWLRDATPVAQIGLFRSPEPADRNTTGPDEGATRMLTQLKHQFDIVGSETDWSSYELLILPDNIPASRDLAQKLSAYVKRGGSILATGLSGLDADGSHLSLPFLPIKPAGLSPFTTTYCRVGKAISDDVPPTDHVMYDRSVRVTPAAGATALARIVEPYFERSWEHFSSHFQTPPSKLSRYAAAVSKGRIAYVAYPIFTSFARYGNYPARLLVRNILEQLLPEPLLRLDGPTTTETTVMRQRGRAGGRTIVHLLQYAPERRTETFDVVEDIVPLFNIPLSLKLDRAPKKVYFAPDESPIPFEYLAGRVNLRVPVINGHAMVVFE
jgi:hypothetical protein